MNGEEKILELIGKMYSEMTEGFKSVNKRLDRVENEVRKTNNVIENEIKPKMEALFDGHVQNTVKIDRIEAEVVKHDGFILKQVR